ncbi:exported hypothetical protein [Candidatus Terasakiella magnetica]|uniref:Uncharacterized protein n=1 Tax=Candidatus Terasakiella magnetica TaxID=1867952 RepID=A0A1C3RHX7_9PROT|nr:transporter substrate-binding domain-containing protein [Candidatus Terasakiella magnetica]SCA56891.1 exported hypothetical protein [Candidatus Terasakiella magnetica]
MKRSFYIFLAGLVLLLTPSYLAQIKAATTLNFYASENGLRPFYWIEDHVQKGIIPDIFSSLPEYELNFVEAPRKRIDAYIKDARVDLIMLHPNYTKEDDLLEFVPLQFSQKNTLFALQENKSKFAALNGVTGTSVCARDGYIYINMGKRWAEQSLRRENLKNNIKLLQMLSFKRCEFAIGSSLSMKYLLKEYRYDNIVETDILVNEVPRFLAVSKRHPLLTHLLSKHLEELKASGKLDQILQKYAP